VALNVDVEFANDKAALINVEFACDNAADSDPIRFNKTSPATTAAK
jgi:hypothetical protein